MSHPEGKGSPTRRLRGSVAVCIISSFVLGLSQPASADHVAGTYRAEGFWQAATRSNGYLLFAASNSCNQGELAAYGAVVGSTQGSGGTFGSRWPGGINMQRSLDGNACTGTLTTGTDIRLTYYSTDTAWHNAGHTTEAGGEEHRVAAPASYCSMWGVQSPCGLHPSRIHVNGPKYNGAGYNRSRLIMHETGHSQGLGLHCSSDSVMNDGSSGCNGGAWGNVTGYLATDRAGVVAVYPSWQYN